MICIKNISYRPNEKTPPILSDLSLEIDERELTVLLGESGTGKSTLGLLLAGAIEPDMGQILINGIPLEKVNDKPGFLHQNPEYQILGTSVERDIAYGLENKNLSRTEMALRVKEALKQFQLEPYRSTSPNDLSGGEKQRTALAGLFASGHQYLILDEPTSYLDHESRNQLITQVKQLSRSGVGILWITQYKDEAYIGERTLILGSNGIVSDSRDEMDKSQVNDDFELRGMVLSSQIEWDNPFLHIKNVKMFYPQVQETTEPFTLEVSSLKIHSGERQGWFGASGSGKTTLAKICAGILQPPKNDTQTILNSIDIVYVPQFAEQMLYSGTLDQTIQLLKRRPGFEPERYRGELERQLTSLGIKYDAVFQRPIWTFSGGEQRRIVIGVALALNPQLLILDEPTIGISPGDRNKLNQIFTSGSIPAIICISHEFHFLRQVTNSGVYFENGKVSPPTSWEKFDKKYQTEEIAPERYHLPENVSHLI